MNAVFRVAVLTQKNNVHVIFLIGRIWTCMLQSKGLRLHNEITLNRE